ncbi:MAG: endo-1,4-beta-xylanase [Clostridia bacterium]|nr:endo-1,4-beta-xylanase [Clostridia bacterium]
MMKRISALLLAATMLLTGIPALAEDGRLFEMTEKYGFKSGGCMSYYQLRDQKYLEMLKKHFNSVTMTNEMKAYSLLDQRASQKAEDGMPRMNYKQADAMVGWAQANGLGVRGHVLVWDAYMCDWFFREDYDTRKPYADQETIRKRTEYYITEVVTHFEQKFPGVVYCWDVVNEAVGDSLTEWLPGDPRHLRTKRSGGDNLFYQYMGEDYVEYAFLYARNAVDALGADIKLYYNDYNAYFTDKGSAIKEMVRSINSFATNPDGTPRKLLDGVGMQGYIGGYGTQNGCMVHSHLGMIKSAIQGYAALGVDVQITEMAVRNFDPNAIEQHKEFYTNLYKVFRSLYQDGHNPLSCVAVWGMVDTPNEKPGSYSYAMNGTHSGLFTEKWDEKPVLHSIIDMLGE